MPTWLLWVLLALLFALIAAWMLRRLLDVTVGWIRAWITAIVVFAFSAPVAMWSLTQAQVYVDGRVTATLPIAIAFFAITLGWMFAAVAIAVLTLEFLWPTRGIRNPITV